MSDWDPHTITQLRDLWGQGLTTAVIGQRLNVSKNAVVGKAHRLKLPPRPSPIRRAGEAGRIESKTSRPPQKRLTRILLGTEAGSAPPAVIFAPLTPAALPKLPSLPTAEHPSRRTGHSLTVRQCSWPIGDPGMPSFHFCASDAELGKPYCREHCGIAYRRQTKLGCDVAVPDQGAAA